MNELQFKAKNSNMNRHYLVGLGSITAFFMACSGEEDKFKAITLEYPETNKIEHIDEYWGERIPEPYRWLEDDHSAETMAWVMAQNQVSFGYLEQIPFRDQVRERLEEVWDYEKNSHDVLTSKDNYLYIQTNLDAPNNKLVKVHTQNPATDNWSEVIPETDNVLETSTAGGKIFATYLKPMPDTEPESQPVKL